MNTLKLSGEVGIRAAAKLLQNDEVVAIPTETVYGLAANALSQTAVEKIFKAKGRPQDNPLIVHINSYKMLDILTKNVPLNARKLMDEFWPGELTIVLNKRKIVPRGISKNLDTVAVRFPSHKIAIELINCSQLPLAAPSANISGKPSPTNAHHVARDMDGKISAILDGGECQFGLESTVIDMTKVPPILLRPGKITKEQIEGVIGKILVDKSITELISNSEKVSSPGMKYKHYAPNARVTVVTGNPTETAGYIKQHANLSDGILCFDEFFDFFSQPDKRKLGSEFDINAQAKNLFSALRDFDDTDVSHIFAQCPSDDGVGLAVANRLKKSSGFNVVSL